MPSRPRWLPALTLLLAGCAIGGSQATTGGGPLPSGSWVARVSSASALGVRGEVRLVPIQGRDDQMLVEVELRAVRDRARYPWVIRSGRCGETTSRDLSPRAVAVITGTVDETARLKTTVPIRLFPGESYHFAIAASPNEPDVYVACGPLISVP